MNITQAARIIRRNPAKISELCRNGSIKAIKKEFINKDGSIALFWDIEPETVYDFRRYWDLLDIKNVTGWEKHKDTLLSIREDLRYPNKNIDMWKLWNTRTAFFMGIMINPVLDLQECKRFAFSVIVDIKEWKDYKLIRTREVMSFDFDKSFMFGRSKAGVK